MSLQTALLKNELPAVRRVVRELCPGGKPDFEKIFREGSSVALFRKVAGDAETATMIFTMIEDMAASLNVFTPMNRKQITDLAEEFLETLDWVTMEDLAVFLNGIPKQLWGHVNNRLDAAVVWEFWDVYALSRTNHHYNREAQYQHENKTGDRMSNEVQDKMRKALKDIDTSWRTNK